MLVALSAKVYDMTLQLRNVLGVIITYILLYKVYLYDDKEVYLGFTIKDGENPLWRSCVSDELATLVRSS